MAGRAAAAARTDFAARMLLKGHSSSRVVADLASKEGISSRSARRYVAKAYQAVVDDLEECGIDRKHLTAQTVHMLQEAAAKALDHDHPSAVVGACRELRELLGLGVDSTPHRLGRYGRSGL